MSNKNAEIAQLVEHNLAKVGVASSSLVFRSKQQTNIGAVVQLVRILACHARGRGFEPRPHRNKEREPHKVLFFMKGKANIKLQTFHNG